MMNVAEEAMTIMSDMNVNWISTPEKLDVIVITNAHDTFKQTERALTAKPYGM
jgi:hypothetical protein